MSAAATARSALATKIEIATRELLSLLQDADDTLQSDEMPRPWDQWEDHVHAVQGAWSDLTDAGDTGMQIEVTCGALRRADRLKAKAAIAAATSTEPRAGDA